MIYLLLWHIPGTIAYLFFRWMDFKKITIRDLLSSIIFGVTGLFLFGALVLTLIKK